jgi:hypothetical protein
LSSVLTSFGFTPSMADTSLFILHHTDVTVYIHLFMLMTSLW